jgi:hypothetical protein
MAIVFVFPQSNFGRAAGIEVDGMAPVNRIRCGVNYNVDQWAILGSSRALAGEIATLSDNSARYYNALLASATGNATADQKALADSGAAQPFLAPSYISNTEAQAGQSQASAVFWTKRAQIPLDQIIQPMGLITTFTLAFKESVNVAGGSPPPVGSPLLGEASVGGVAFDGVCGGGSNDNRHGIEPILEYYYHHRISNAGHDLTATTLTFGNTVLKGYVSGMHAEPQDLDYRIWRWAIELVIDPKYLPKPPMRPYVGGSVSGEAGLHSTSTAEQWPPSV